MNNQRTLSTLLLLLTLAASAQAQRNGLALNQRITDQVTTYRLGKQGVSLNGLNRALQQANYQPLPDQFTVLGVQSAYSTQKTKRISVISEFDIALGPSSLSVTNGTNTARAFVFQWGFGVGYRIIDRNQFSLMPKLMLSPSYFSLTVAKNNTPPPTLAAILASPSNTERATLNTMTFTADLGLTGQYRFTYGAKTVPTECGTQTQERSLVVGFDAGYRLGANTRFNRSMGSTDGNPTVNLSGWYVAVRLGLGRRDITAQ
jgi:hypothetical protein